MKNLTFSLILGLLGSISSYSQVNVIATLQHDGQIRQFYGAEALINSYNYAQHGDTITLSPGYFTVSELYSGNIPFVFDKAITIRGAGSRGSSGNTSLIGGKTISIYSTNGQDVSTWEGVRFIGDADVKIYNKEQPGGQGKIEFIKCYFYNLATEISEHEAHASIGPSIRIYNCYIGNTLLFRDGSKPDVMIYNSYINEVISNLWAETTSAITNCLIRLNGDRTGARSTKKLNFYNCIFYWTGNNSGANFTDLFASDTTCKYCLSINKQYLLWGDSLNYTADDAGDVFKTFDIQQASSILGIDGKEDFRLKEEAKKMYIGMDGTEVGMYGGLYPYSVMPQYPIITKFIVGTTSSKEGKLRLEIEVDKENAPTE